MYQDDELVMLSALQHYQFCQRQCALIHQDEVWSDNYLTASGEELHKHVDSNFRESRPGVHIATTLHLVSHKLGVVGIADLVEFHKYDDKKDKTDKYIATSIPGLKGLWIPFPVEYKRGKPKSNKADEIQLCAQAICLEEMLDVKIMEGALFYGEIRKRSKIAFDHELRELTAQVAQAVHVLLKGGELPKAIISQGCEACSIVNVCCPQIILKKVSAKQWLDKYLEEVTGK